MSKESEHWPFGNWPGKGPVETKRENDNKERLRELAAKVAIEQDHDKFTALVQELNQLLDGEKQERHNAADAWDRSPGLTGMFSLPGDKDRQGTASPAPITCPVFRLASHEEKTLEVELEPK
jgi:hypothetical protein